MSEITEDEKVVIASAIESMSKSLDALPGNHKYSALVNLIAQIVVMTKPCCPVCRALLVGTIAGDTVAAAEALAANQGEDVPVRH